MAAERRRRVLLALAVTVVCLGLDLWTKSWAWQTLRIDGRRRVIDGFFHLEFAFNTGSAFGMLRNAEWARAAFIVITIAALAYMVKLALTIKTENVAGFVAVGLISGGALGNLHDRLFRSLLLMPDGKRYGVVDFLVVFYWPGRRWPAFNIADVALLLGVGMFMVYLHRARPDAPASD